MKIELYGFRDLSDKVQCKLIEEERSSIIDFMVDPDFFANYVEEEVDRVFGLVVDFELYYSLNYSQGDGVSFTGTPTKDLVLAEARKRGGAYNDLAVLLDNGCLEVDLRIERHNYSYRHERTVGFVYDINYNTDIANEEVVEEYVEYLVEYLEEERVEFCQRMEREGYSHYYPEIDSIDIEEYFDMKWFTKDGQEVVLK